jgi:hypothetical protein
LYKAFQSFNRLFGASEGVNKPKYSPKGVITSRLLLIPAIDGEESKIPKSASPFISAFIAGLLPGCDSL